VCPQSSEFRDGDCICDETFPDPAGVWTEEEIKQVKADAEKLAKEFGLTKDVEKRKCGARNPILECLCVLQSGHDGFHANYDGLVKWVQ
jgi:hypothetical protein